MTTKDEALKLALDALEKSKQTHYYCEDIWYSCPKHEEGCANDAEGDECNCGADEVNARNDEAIAALLQAISEAEQAEQEPVALAIQAQKSADYWMNHYDRKSKSDMEVLHRHVLQEFKAIRAEALEEAAKRCENRIGGAVQTNEWWSGFKAAMKQCAAAIRGLK